MEVEVSEEQYERVKALLEHFITNKGLYKYNYKGLLYGLFNREAYCDDCFLCSEFVYYLLKEGGIVDFRISRNLVRPQNLLHLKSKIIYEGNLKDAKFTNNYWNTKKISLLESS